MAINELIDPKLLSSVKGLELLAREIIDSYLHGSNQSVRIGHGQEFSQYRSYEAGDDLRMLDWKLFARSDRYYVREAEIESNISVRFIIDASASMAHRDGAYEKIQFARLIAATLGYLATQQGDAISLYGINNQDIYYLSAKQNRQHFYRFLYELIRIQPHGKWPENKRIGRYLNQSGQKELIVCISDMYQEEDEIINILKLLRSEKNEIILIQLMAQNELHINFEHITALQDLESNEIIQVDPASEQRRYNRRLDQFFSGLKRKLLDLNIHYQMIEMNESLDQSIRDFLKTRMKLL
ncbi:MAG: DUF58 domain-containing protein [Calditrichaeota bacterium]|nr:DUF58 domain-containing protein [Calditrichota bacterium]